MPIIIDDSSVLSVEEIVGEIKKHILKDGIACTFIDYVGLIENNKQEDYINISYSYKILKKLAKESQSPIIILNQYLKDFKGREKTGYKPNMFDMTGGKSAMNDSHKIIHIWKPDKFPDFTEKHPEYIGKIIVFSDKNRDGAFGDMPEIPLQFENGQLKETQLIRESIKNTVEQIFGDSENV